jgi:hypothetical protein
MAKPRWLRSHIVVSVALTLTAAGLLVRHVRYDPTGKIDAWAVGLLIVMFLPWLGGIFETIEFPGGAKVSWRARIEEEQARQAKEIASVVDFLTEGLLTDSERKLLQQLVNGPSLPTGVGPTARAHTMKALVDKKMIAANPPTAPDAEFATLQDAVNVTDRGRRSLRLLSELPAQDDRHQPD